MDASKDGVLELRILIISQYWAPENGVPQRRWSWLTRVLEDAGHQVSVVAPPPHYNRHISFSEWRKSSSFRARVERQVGETSETIVRTGFFPSGRSLTQRIMNQAAVAVAGLWVIAKLPGSLGETKPDVVIGTVPALPTAVVTYLAGRRFGVPYLIDLRDAWPDLMVESERWNSSLGNPSIRERVFRLGPLQLLGFLTTRAINFSLRRASAILVTSSRLGESLENDFSKGNLKSHHEVAVVRNVFPAQVGAYKKQSPELSKSELKILYAGTLGRAQNLANALRALRFAEGRGLNVHLRLVGAGAARKELVKIAQQENLNVDFSSKIEPDELVEHYKWADSALVHLTDWKALEQAVPSKTYELMSVGLHISAVVSGETADLIARHGAGHVVPPEEPEQLAALWQSLIEDPSLLAVGNAGAKWVREQRENLAPQRLLETLENLEPRGF